MATPSCTTEGHEDRPGVYMFSTWDPPQTGVACIECMVPMLVAHLQAQTGIDMTPLMEIISGIEDVKATDDSAPPTDEEIAAAIAAGEAERAGEGEEPSEETVEPTGDDETAEEVETPENPAAADAS